MSRFQRVTACTAGCLLLGLTLTLGLLRVVPHPAPEGVGADRAEGRLG